MQFKTKLLFFDTISSTHEYAKLHADKFDPKELTCIRAYIQTAGVGQLERSWISLPGNLLISYVVKVAHQPYPDAANFLSLCLYKVISSKDRSIFFKEPNDLYFENKKFAGVLCHQSGDRLILSFGINTDLAPTEFGTLHLDSEELFMAIDLFLSEQIPLYLSQGFSFFDKEWKGVSRLS